MPFHTDSDTASAAARGSAPISPAEAASEKRTATGIERAILFIDGSNWYHSLKRIGVSSKLDYRALASRLVEHRLWVATHYYVGRVTGNLRWMRDQDRFLRFLRDAGIFVHLGRIQRNPMSAHFAREKGRIVRLLQQHETAAPSSVGDAIRHLSELDSPQYVEKEVDTRMAVDLVRLAYRNEYDVAYILSADSDFIPAVEAVRELGKTVFAASPARATPLAAAVDTYIPLRRDWFEGLGAG